MRARSSQQPQAEEEGRERAPPLPPGNEEGKPRAPSNSRILARVIGILSCIGTRHPLQSFRPLPRAPKSLLLIFPPAGKESGKTGHKRFRAGGIARAADDMDEKRATGAMAEAASP